ncbi:SRPBCC domain-containing protein [Chitinophaga sp. Hz27]|uniref:SRPBCC family protein n=1 Tax=Chitinophaga sp. Hz27 TaxID=3347169 RepID=UPI0035E1D38C
MTEKYTHTITVGSSKAILWRVLTDTSLMAEWMGTPDMQIGVVTSWELDTAIRISGFHHVAFENKGMVMEWEQEKRLVYSHLSSVSRLPDVAESYSLIGFELNEKEGGTALTVIINHFPTEVIRKHLEFYWRGTIYKIKEIAEKMM